MTKITLLAERAVPGLPIFHPLLPNAMMPACFIIQLNK
jgi:hypothetical protein